MKPVNINVHYITRVEGHGNIILNAMDGKIEELKMGSYRSAPVF